MLRYACWQCCRYWSGCLSESEVCRAEDDAGAVESRVAVAEVVRMMSDFGQHDDDDAVADD